MKDSMLDAARRESGLARYLVKYKYESFFYLNLTIFKFYFRIVLQIRTFKERLKKDLDDLYYCYKKRSIGSIILFLSLTLLFVAILIPK